MRWNNYDLNVYVDNGTVFLTAHRLKWTGSVDVHGFPLYTQDYGVGEQTTHLYLNRPEHRKAICYALDNEYWDSLDELNIYPKHSDLSPVASYWQDHDEWATASEWLRVPEPIKSWLKSLPVYNVELTPEIEAQLIQHGMLDDDGSSILEWI
jgi:hypothetical protein